LAQYPNLAKINPDALANFKEKKPDLQNPMEQFQLIAGKSAQTANQIAASKDEPPKPEFQLPFMMVDDFATQQK
jgi:hypothetical protein